MKRQTGKTERQYEKEERQDLRQSARIAYGEEMERYQKNLAGWKWSREQNIKPPPGIKGAELYLWKTVNRPKKPEKPSLRRCLHWAQLRYTIMESS